LQPHGEDLQPIEVLLLPLGGALRLLGSPLLALPELLLGNKLLLQDASDGFGCLGFKLSVLRPVGDGFGLLCEGRRPVERSTPLRPRTRGKSLAIEVVEPSVVGLTRAVMAPRICVAASAVFMPPIVMAANAACSSSRLTPSCAASGAARPKLTANSRHPGGNLAKDTRAL